jgi:uncharacterized protein (TIGR02284 family)
MADRDRQNPYWNEQQDWRERNRSWLREGQQQGWQGRRESQWTPDAGYRSRGAYGSDELERNDQAQRDYVFGEQQGNYSTPWQRSYGAGQQRPLQRRGPKGYRRSDERIREDVCERLMMSGLDASEVTVDVRDGTVILEGYVTERRTKYAIEDTAEQAFGVDDVENNVRVSRGQSDWSWTGRNESPQVDGLNRCLRSELSAIETYRQALDRDRQDFGTRTEFQRLTEILREHEEAASRLQQVIRQAGGEPSTDSGAWGTWSKIIMGAAKLFGDKAALKSLKEGEESGLKEYERCLRDADVSPQTRDLLTELMSRQQRHIRELDSLIDAVDRR